MYKRFPNVEAICIEAELKDLKGASVAASISKLNPKIHIVGLSSRVAAPLRMGRQDYRFARSERSERVAGIPGRNGRPHRHLRSARYLISNLGLYGLIDRRKS
jgi:hypothetical protein